MYQNFDFWYANMYTIWQPWIRLVSFRRMETNIEILGATLEEACFKMGHIFSADFQVPYFVK
jgi:hypothetical protein